MNQSAKSWLLWMMVPLFIAVIVYFIVPLQVIVNSNPRLQENFNNYRIQVEQNTVRAISFLSSRIITTRMQMYRNILSSFKRLLSRQSLWETLNISSIKLNSAYQLANQNQNQTFSQKLSMWYSPNVSTQQQMNNIQKQIFDEYKSAQPYLQYSICSQNKLLRTILSSQTIINYENQRMYFKFPSQRNIKWQQQNQDVLNNLYNNTIANFMQSNLNMTIFDIGPIIQMCTVIFFKNSRQPNGVTCFDLSINVLISDLASQTKDIDLSVNDYYYVRPLYDFQQLSDPQIVANFSSTNLSNIEIPYRKFFSLQASQLPRQILKGDRYYSMNIQRLQQTKTYYTIPINSFNTKNTNEVLLYLIVLNNFARAEFSQESRNQKIVMIMVVPSIVILLVSIFVTTFVLKRIFQKLNDVLGMMEDYCSLIQRGDLELQIPQYNEAEDLRKLFKELAKLNQLNKYSDFQYFNVPKPERIIRLLKCMKLFEELGYDLTNLYENICECYVQIGDMKKALSFLRMSIDNTIKQTYLNRDQIDKIYQAKVEKTIKIDKIFRKEQKILSRKILRICQLLYVSSQQDPEAAQKQIVMFSEMLKKVIFPDILSYEYIGCYMFIVKYEVAKGKSQILTTKLQTLYELINGYAQLNYNKRNRQASPQIMYSYYNSIKMNLALQQKNYLQAFNLCLLSLEGSQFNPIIHSGANATIQKILEMHQIKKQELNNFKYMSQYKPRGKRQYVFLIDVSKPEMNNQDVSQWKKKARAMAEHIFNTQVENADRVSITQFCLDIKIICNLVEKGNRQKILKKELLSSIKARDQNIMASVISCLRKSVQRVKHLKNEKVFIMFLKEGLQLSCIQILQELEEVENVKTLLFIQNRHMIVQKNQQIQVLNYEDFEDVDRILGPKTIKQADNIVYIF